MLRHPARCRMMVIPVVVEPETRRTRDTSTPPADSRSSAICPSGVIANQRLKSDTASKRRKIMGDDCGRTAQGKHHAVGQQFPFRRKLLRESVEDEVEVQFSGDSDIKSRHV